MEVYYEANQEEVAFHSAQVVFAVGLAEQISKV